MEDNRAGNQELLVASGNKRYKKIYRRIWHILENEKSDKSTSRKVKVKWDIGKTINIFDSEFYYKVTTSS